MWSVWRPLPSNTCNLTVQMFNGAVLGCRPENCLEVAHSSSYSPYHVMGQLSLGCRSKPGTCSPGGSTGPHGALRPLARPARPVHPRLARGRPAGPPPGGSPGVVGAPSVVGRAQSRCRPCAAALPGSVPGRPRGSGQAWRPPRFSPVFPGPTRRAGWREPEGVCPAAHWPGLRPAGACGATFLVRAVRDLPQRIRSGRSVPGAWV